MAKTSRSCFAKIFLSPTPPLDDIIEKKRTAVIRLDRGTILVNNPSTATRVAMNNGDRMTEHCIVLTTGGSAEEAKRIAHELVHRQLAACVNILSPIESVYRWKGVVESATEWLLIVKTTTAAFERVRDAIRELHSYELPECIQLGIDNGSAEYLRWISENVK